MSTPIDILERKQLRDDIPRFKAGDTVRVHFQVIEGQRRRVQVFEGIVIKRQGAGARETFTVRKNSFGVGVERTFPLHSPKIERIEVQAIGDVNRAQALLPSRQGGEEGARPREAAELGAILGPVRRTGRKLLNFDRKLGVRYVAGADEAGRGSLAGRSSRRPSSSTTTACATTACGRSALLNDSKQLSRRRARAASSAPSPAAPRGSPFGSFRRV